jgi:DNA-binding response OmpR family regulator
MSRKPGAPNTSPKRVLLIADDPLVGTVLMERLMREHYSVYWARDILEARELWKSNFYYAVSSI